MTNTDFDNEPELDRGDTSLYFAPLLPWQKQAWSQVVGQFYGGHLPHGILAGGMAGIGKRAFVWRFVAWLLCQDKAEQGACGVCESCGWLRAGTHPDLLVLPASSQLGETGDKRHIKIDDVRALQEYSHVKGKGVRLIVLDNAETLTLGAGNALLKTLEEPRDGVHLFLISDNMARLLPTIKSRVQALSLMHIDQAQAIDYIKQTCPEHQDLAPLLLSLSDGAVLRACELPQMAWFGERTLWVKTFVALRTGSRLPMVASDYWQTMLGFDELMVLTRLMLLDVVRVYLGLPSLHTDMDVAGLLQNSPVPDLTGIENLLATLDDMTLATGQNVQEKMAYDTLFTKLASL